MAFPTGWGRKCELVVQSGQVTSDCTDFPILVTKDTLPSEIFDADGSYPALSGGGDLRFSSDSAGATQLPCEVVTFTTDNDPANGVAEVWVKRTISSSSNTSIWIWYNKSGETQPVEDNTYGKENVWDSNFKVVQHMNQDPSGAAPQMIDSTSNDKDGTSYGTMLTGDLVSGQIGNGLDFDGSNDYISCPNPIAQAATNATYSLWVNQDVRSPSAYNSQFISMQDGTGTGRSIVFVDDAQTSTNKTGSYILGSLQLANTVLSLDTSYFICLTKSGTTFTWYLDGSLDGTFNGAADAADGNLVLAVHKNTTAGFLDGILDEIHVSDIARSAGWITTEYNNQKTPNTFLVEGTPETPGGVGGTATITANGPLTISGKSARSSSTTATANGALTVAAVAGHLGDGAITANGDLTLTGLSGHLGAASITANGTLTLGSVAGRSSAVGIEGNGDLIGAGLGGHTGIVLLSKNGELTVVGSATSYDAYGTVAVTGNGSLVVTGGMVTPGAVVISAGGNLTGAGLKDQMFEEVWLDSDLAQGVVSPSPLWRADCGY